MNVSSITLNENCKPRRNLFIKYSNSFMSMMNGGSEAVEKAQKVNPSNDKKLDKSMGIETLTIFPKQVIDGKTITGSRRRCRGSSGRSPPSYP